MRVALTIADATAGRSADVVLDADPQTPISEVASGLARHLSGAGRGNIVQIGASIAARRGSDTLFVDGAALDPSESLQGSPLVDGALASLGHPQLGRLSEPDGLIELRVVSGDGAGVVHLLALGDTTIGADPNCIVVVSGADVPQIAATVTVARDGTAALRPAPDARVVLDREPVPTGGVTWHPGSEVQVGNVLLEVHRPEPPDAALLRSPDGAWLDYNRPPRLLPPKRKTTFRLPARPQQPPRGGLPALGSLAPAVLGVAMSFLFHNPTYLLMAAMTPLMLLGNAFSSKRQGKKSYRVQLAEFRENTAAIEADAAEALVTERHARREAGPDAAQLLLTATGPRARLWERRRVDPDHLLLRVGTSDLESEVVVEDPEQLEHRRMVQRMARDVPVSVSLRDSGVIGVAGGGDLPRRIAAWMVGQLAVLQSPQDVQMHLLTESQAEDAWRWASWLPHLTPPGGREGAFALIGNDGETLGRRVAELGQVVTGRHRARVDGSSSTTFGEPDIVVLLDGARRLRALPGVISLLRDGPAVGVYSICIDSDRRLLPEECAAVVAEAADGLDVSQQRADDITGVRADLVPPAWFQRVARALAPVRDVSDSGDDGALPSSARLLDVLSLEPPTPDAVVARWSLGGATTEAVIGASIDGPFSIDLRRDGPHGLIAGTTGSGKSELLQTIVASLAVANRPDAMTFVLVDYKGGAAFKDCVDLPHTVGMVTDLDTHLVERALTSLGAELTRREHLLAAAGAKDLEDYVDYRTRDTSLAAIPRLLIVIDEFASMARELPDFVTGLVNIAQRGRSLGIHLILATQRPTGVVSPEIRANTNLRIALRVTDPAESSDVIDVADAARIAKSTPGRGYVRLGHASLMPFQSGRVGGRRPGGAGTEQVRRAPWLATLSWPMLGQPAPMPPQQVQADDLEITDLAVLVGSIREASERLDMPPQHSPWLAALPALVPDDQFEPPQPLDPDSSHVPRVPYAIEDIPAEQAQHPAMIDFATFGHLYVPGAPRSGRSQVLRTIAGMVARYTSCADVHLFGIDCGNGALLPLTKLPHCGAVVQRTQTERATRLITRLRTEVLARQELLGSGGFADITEQRAAAEPDARLPHLLVLLDRWEGFTTTLGEVDGGALTETLWMVMREGASAGVHLVISGDRSLLTGRVSTLTEDKLTLRLTDRGDYSLAGLNPRKMPEDVAQGRAFRADSAIETQIAVLGTDPSGPGQVEALARIGAAAVERDVAVPRSRRAFRVDVLPSNLSFDDAWTMRPDDVKRPMWGLVGVGGDELIALGPDLGNGVSTFVIAGPPKSGRSSVLLSMARSFLAGGAEVVITAPRSSPLRDLAGTPGVRAVISDDDLTDALLDEHLSAGDDPVVLLMDDAEMHKEISGKDWLRSYIRASGDRNRAIVIAGNAAEVCQGFSGWQIDVRKNRNGALLSPQNLTDGDIVGLRVPRSAIGGQVQPGRAMVHLGDGELVTVQVPVAGT